MPDKHIMEIQFMVYRMMPKIFMPRLIYSLLFGWFLLTSCGNVRSLIVITLINLMKL